MADNVSVSGTTDPYTQQYYSAGSTEKNTLTVTSFIKLLAAQLANQDMTNPMSNSEMMGQMTQMAMVQSMGAMTDSITTRPISWRLRSGPQAVKRRLSTLWDRSLRWR